ncbi:MAG: response regulator, partial [Deltaproteobacteria bacterium]|nr:response regulator [Deltaproteobacteria bacterium]
MNSKFDALRVLVIDDEQSFRDGPERILTRINFEVQKAS